MFQCYNTLIVLQRIKARLNSMKNIFKKNWRILYLLYILIYMPWFFFIERIITSDTPGLHLIHCPIDDLIPFCSIFIIPYLFWFLYMIMSCIYVYFKGTDAEYRRLAISLVVGMSITLIFYMIYPNGHNLRPDSITDDGIFSKLILIIYSADTSTNVFPSIHVYNSLVAHFALWNISSLKKHPAIRISSLVLCILICLSTVFLKQHSFLDLIGGAACASLAYVLAYRMDYSRFTAAFKK